MGVVGGVSNVTPFYVKKKQLLGNLGGLWPPKDAWIGSVRLKAPHDENVIVRTGII